MFKNTVLDINIVYTQSSLFICITDWSHKELEFTVLIFVREACMFSTPRTYLPFCIQKAYSQLIKVYCFTCCCMLLQQILKISFIYKGNQLMIGLQGKTRKTLYTKVTYTYVLFFDIIAIQIEASAIVRIHKLLYTFKVQCR